MIASVTLYFPPVRLPAMITRLTTYLLEHQYGFLQTYETLEQTAFEVVDAQERSIVRLTLTSNSAAAAQSATQVLSEVRHLAPDAVSLLQHLLQLEA